MTLYLTLEQVLGIHVALSHASPLGARVRDVGLVQSAVARPQATVYGQEAYRGIWDKAAALLHSLASNHGFMDGDKRVAWVAAWTFLEINGHPLDPGFDVDAAEKFMLSVADGKIDSVFEVSAELKKYSRPTAMN